MLKKYIYISSNIYLYKIADKDDYISIKFITLNISNYI